MHSGTSLTPMFRQYRDLKSANPNAVLLFRMGDFYEMFYEDAKEASGILEIALTVRGKGTAHAAPMCGFPHHQLDAYTARLVGAGRRVAVCEQVEDPKKAKGLVRRDVVRVITPGTLSDPEHLDEREPLWVASVSRVGGRVAAAFLDASTGEFLAWEDAEGGGWPALADRIAAFGPREIVYSEDMDWPEGGRSRLEALATLSPSEPYAFVPRESADLLLRHFGVASLDGFGLRDALAATSAAGGLLAYLRDTQRSGLEHVDRLVRHEPSRHLLLDGATRRNLEVDRSLRGAGREGSLLSVVDATVTAPGARLLRSLLLAPLTDAEEIGRRLDAVEELVETPAMRGSVREGLSGMRDLERLVGRAVAGTANARDLLALRGTLDRTPAVLEAIGEAKSERLREIGAGTDPCGDLARLLAESLADDPPAGLREGGLLKDGFHAELDELRSIRRDGRAYIASLEAKERTRTGIGSLKVRFNKVFGYFIEVSKANLHLVPGDYVRKQTIAAGERYITPELKEYETKVLNAQDRIVEIELEAFAALRSQVASQAGRIKAVARSAAWLDVLSALAETAARGGWRRPVLREGSGLRIRGGRHPVVERFLAGGRFVPNDTRFEPPGRSIAILTGPNMGGKSTYLRQVAILVLLAQCGSFVPAEEAEIGLVDRIFCRVGASDSLAEGQSTFMVEMTETAHILHHATTKSLVLLDEIGRGTSTFDGLAIAWAIVEHLHGRPQGPPRTLFATHYHELTELAVSLAGVVNSRMAVRESGERVLFTHRVEEGAADRSYGIHVARLAGIPAAVLARADEILENLERDEFGVDGLPRRARRGRGRARAAARPEAPLFGPAASSPAEPPAETLAAAEVLAEIRSRDPDRLTPLEALRVLADWKRRLRDLD